MSAPLARRVYDSGLAANLKPLAAMIAFTFADDAGDRVFPSVRGLAWMMGIDDRSIQRQLKKLRELGVLVVVSPVAASGPSVERVARTGYRRRAQFDSGSQDRNVDSFAAPFSGATTRRMLY
jgi:hypothetical protein